MISDIRDHRSLRHGPKEVSGRGDLPSASQGTWAVRVGRRCLVLVGMLFLQLGCSPADPSPDREVGQWVLSHGGSVTVVVGTETIRLPAGAKLPKGPLRLTEVRWDIYPGDRNPHVNDAQLAQFAQLQHLQDLDLWGADITDAGIAQLGQLSSLRRLQLSATGVTDAGLKELQKLTQLQQLALVDCAVTSQGVRQLRRAVPGCQVLIDAKSQR